MKLLVATDHHFTRESPCNFSPAPPAIVDYAFWSRYLDVFEDVGIVARVGRSEQDDRRIATRANGPGVAILPLPDYSGPWGYLRCLPKLRESVCKAVTDYDAILLRVPGSVGGLVWQETRRQGKPFALEVTGDPWDLLSPGAVLSLTRPIARRFWSRDLRQMCREAAGVSYVTREVLQRRYPARPGAFVTHASSIELKSGIASRSQVEARMLRSQTAGHADRGGPQMVRLGFIGMFYQLYKGPDLLIEAVASLQKAFPAIEVSFVGDGQFLEPMRRLAAKRGLESRSRFLGSIPSGQPIYEFLDGVDMFVLPSRQEGLPRAMIEAMARGCPCIGTEVGGIPELLPPEDMVPPNNARALAQKIADFLTQPGRLETSAWRNWEASKLYSAEAVGPRRREFYSKIRSHAETSRS